MSADYKHSSPPLAVQWALAFYVYLIAAPAGWCLEKLGLAPRLFRSTGAARERQIARKNPFAGYRAGAQDVFVATFPKSGTNWMMQIVHQLIHHGQGEFDHIHDVVPWPDVAAMGGFMKRYAIPLEEADHWEHAPERKRVIKSHLEWKYLPYADDAHYIAVIRDPKEVFVSSYYFLRDSVLGPAMPSVETWLEIYRSDQFLLAGSWAAYAAGFWAERNRPNVRVVSFRSMKADLRQTVTDVAGFLKIDVGEAAIEEVCRRSSFAYMKSIDEKFSMGRLIPWKPPGAMIRRGAAGGSSELLTPGQQQDFRDELARMNSDFPYDEFWARP